MGCSLQRGCAILLGLVFVQMDARVLLSHLFFTWAVLSHRVVSIGRYWKICCGDGHAFCGLAWYGSTSSSPRIRVSLEKSLEIGKTFHEKVKSRKIHKVDGLRWWELALVSVFHKHDGSSQSLYEELQRVERVMWYQEDSDWCSITTTYCVSYGVSCWWIN